MDAGGGTLRGPSHLSVGAATSFSLITLCWCCIFLSVSTTGRLRAQKSRWAARRELRLLSAAFPPPFESRGYSLVSDFCMNGDSVEGMPLSGPGQWAMTLVMFRFMFMPVRGQYFSGGGGEREP